MLESPFAGLKQGVVPGLVKRGRKAQMVSVDDVGAAARMAFEDPARWAGRRFELAGDELTCEELCAVIARVRGEQGRWRVLTPPDLLLRLLMPRAVASLRTFLDERGTHVDLAEVRRELPGVMDVEAWLRFKGLDQRVLPSGSWCVIA